MDFTISQGMLGVRPPVTKPHPAFLDLVGEEGARKMVADHYDLVVESDIKALFPIEADDLAEAKKHAADFIIQICGGPAYFNQNRGAPQMVGRHAPFRINMEARQVWLEEYAKVLAAVKTKDGEDMPEDILKAFWNYLDIFSLWMVNTPS